MKRFGLGILKSLATTVIFFAVCEIGVRAAYAARTAMVRLVPLPYSLGDDYGPIPPWLDRLLILVPDDTLIWRSLPNAERTYVDIFSPVRTEHDRVALLRRFSPWLPKAFRRNPTWHIALNSHGDRMPEYAVAKPASTVRVACIGDSWTFGMNVDQDRTYPSRLAAVLGEKRAARRFEVLNFGVLGYSSFQGLQLLKARVLALRPDLVVIGFGMNDSEVAGYRDKDMVGAPPPALLARLRAAAADHLEVYKLLKYLALITTFRPKGAAAYLREAATEKSGPVDYDAIEPWTRVSPHDFDANIREMIRLSRAAGARVVLADNELWDGSPYRPVLRKISADTGAPLVDSLAIIAAARERIERDLAARLGLSQATAAAPLARLASPAPSALVRVVFRVSHGAEPVTSAISIVGPDPQLGALAPNTVLMHDDGTGGDERARDGVWSFTAAFAPGTHVSYVYTNSGACGRWEGLDVPHVREAVVPPSPDGRPVFLPIETFGRVYMQADDWHTDAVGYDLIARAVADAIMRWPL